MFVNDSVIRGKGNSTTTGDHSDVSTLIVYDKVEINLQRIDCRCHSN